MKQAGVPDVLPDTFICFPREIANRIHYHFNGRLLDAIPVRRPGWFVRIVPHKNGLKYENHQLETIQ